MSDSVFPFVFGMVAGIIIFMAALTMLGFPEFHFEAGARAVCESHGLELDSYEYIGSVPGFEFVKCKPVDPVPVFGVFENIGSVGK